MNASLVAFRQVDDEADGSDRWTAAARDVVAASAVFAQVADPVEEDRIVIFER